MRIACDLDGVLADLHSAYAQQTHQLFPELDPLTEPLDVGASPPADLATGTTAAAAVPVADKALPRAQSEAVWRALAAKPNFWESLDEIEPGLIRRFAKIADERQWEVLFVTSRPRSAGDSVQRQSQRWLERHGFPLPSVYVVHGSRGQVVKALEMDVLIDDRPNNCIDVALEARAATLLVWRGDPETVPGSVQRLEISVLATAGACLDALVALDDRHNSASLVDRLKQLFGARKSRRSRR